MKIRSSTIVAAFLCAAFSASLCSAADTDRQGFRVIVPTTISIAAPATSATITHDQSDSNQPFPVQTWTVKGNLATGVNVAFSTMSAFVNNADSASRRNVQLGLAVNGAQGPASWVVTRATDSTNYLSGDEVAQVTAESDGAGSANFDLSVTFVTEDFDLFTAGQYEVTVVGTVAAN